MASSKNKSVFWLLVALLFGFVIWVMSGKKMDAMWKNIGYAVKNANSGGSK